MYFATILEIKFLLLYLNIIFHLEIFIKLFKEFYMEKIRTRFAPSPTGFLHIGGLRTALFSYLFARHNEGDFILRIEDTDRKRLVEGALENIIQSLKWMGIEWDEGPDIGGPYSPYLQSERKPIYKKYAFKLVQDGKAYKCYCTHERIKALHEEEIKKGLFPIYDRHCRNLTVKEIEQNDNNGMPFVIRLKVPIDGEISFNDEIRGNITTKNETLDDIVLLKSDGFPTYHLANVVDDHLMKITHVIRGEEWVPSTPKHIILYNAFGWKPPSFAHVPVILAKGGGKLSKRHGATTVREFIEKGYLSDALLNFMALLGWSLDDKSEFFTMDQLIKHFELNNVKRSPAIFSYEKLDWFNGVYIRNKNKDEIYRLIIPYLIKDGVISKENEAEYRDYILSIIPLIQERLKLLSDVSKLVWFFFDEHFEIRDKKSLIPKKLKKDDAFNIAFNIINHTIDVIEKVDQFNEANLERPMRDLVKELGLKPYQVFMTIRVAVTGTTISPGLFETMMVLGKKRVIKRLNDALDSLKSNI